jgi:hypothetical protein
MLQYNITSWHKIAQSTNDSSPDYVIRFLTDAIIPHYEGGISCQEKMFWYEWE